MYPFIKSVVSWPNYVFMCYCDNSGIMGVDIDPAHRQVSWQRIGDNIFQVVRGIRVCLRIVVSHTY